MCEVTITFPMPSNSEGTEAPYWLIIDPFKMLRPSVDDVAAMITGPFFSREEAEEHLDARRYAFSDSACVYCHSGHASTVYRQAWREAWAQHVTAEEA
ncbi:hypothetical protein [Nitratidesulfovibrio vulgaris]|uniref:hypothetical protein n=1 Tax=Nitratidesulfovibrio vulgaris TaxID=881 RepID=UPI0013DFF43C|nr:hypothetical protein [Nitratidesulfovibrio vulgaris]